MMHETINFNWSQERCRRVMSQEAEVRFGALLDATRSETVKASVVCFNDMFVSIVFFHRKHVRLSLWIIINVLTYLLTYLGRTIFLLGFSARIILSLFIKHGVATVFMWYKAGIRS